MELPIQTTITISETTVGYFNMNKFARHFQTYKNQYGGNSFWEEPEFIHCTPQQEKQGTQTQNSKNI